MSGNASLIWVNRRGAAPRRISRWRVIKERGEPVLHKYRILLRVRTRLAEKKILGQSPRRIYKFARTHATIGRSVVTFPRSQQVVWRGPRERSGYSLREKTPIKSAYLDTTPNDPASASSPSSITRARGLDGREG